MRSGNIVTHVDVRNADGSSARWTWPKLKTWARANISDHHERQSWLKTAGQAYLDENGSLLAGLLGEAPGVDRRAS